MSGRQLRPRMVPLMLVALLAACGGGAKAPAPTTEAVQESASDSRYPEAIRDYMSEWAAVEHSETARSLEPLLAAAEAVQDAAMMIDDSQLAWLEQLDDADFSRLQADVPGFIFHRGQDIHAEIDGDALLTLAQRKGRPADQAFFGRFVAAYNEQALPLYLRFAGGASPCVRFGEPVLLDQYQGWRSFQQTHAGAYQAFTDRWLADIEDVMVHGTCTCTQKQSPVEETLAAFNSRFPQNPAADRIRARLQQLEEDPYARPVWCR